MHILTILGQKQNFYIILSFSASLQPSCQMCS